MNNYDKIKKKIKEYNKNIRYQCIQGLKGPKGDKGELEPGPKVDKGDSSLEPILYNTLFFVSISRNNSSRIRIWQNYWRNRN